jgi:tetratricopeptide (TPR) repeat protein
MANLEEAKQVYERGIDAYRAGDYDAALETLTQARALYVEAGDRNGESEVLNDLGVVCIQLDEWDDAGQFLGEALAIRQELQNRSGQGITLGNLGMLYDRQGEEEKAAEAYEQAIAIFRELGERGNEKAVLKQLSRLKLKKRRVLEALGDYREGLEGEETPTGAQQLARRLFRLMGRLTGTGPARESDEEAGDDNTEDDLLEQDEG